MTRSLHTLLVAPQAKICGLNPGGDAYVTICLWKMGFAHTDPGISLKRLGVSAFGGVENYRARDLAKDFAAAALGKCKADDYICQVTTSYCSTIHLTGQTRFSPFKTFEHQCSELGTTS